MRRAIISGARSRHGNWSIRWPLSSTRSESRKKQWIHALQSIENHVAVPSRDFVDEAKYARHIFHGLNAGMRTRSNVQQAAPPAQRADRRTRFSLMRTFGSHSTM